MNIITQQVMFESMETFNNFFTMGKHNLRWTEHMAMRYLIKMWYIINPRVMLQLRATSTEYQITRLDVCFRLVVGRAHPGEI